MYKPLTAAAGSQRHADALYGVYVGAQKGLQAQPLYLRGWHSPSSPAKFAWEKLGRLLFVMLQHPLKTTPMWHLRGPHGQCRQPYHSCCQ